MARSLALVLEDVVIGIVAMWVLMFTMVRWAIALRRPA